MSRSPDEGGGAAPPPRVRPFLGAPPSELTPDRTRLAGTDHPALGFRETAAGKETNALRPFVLTVGRVSDHADLGLHTQVTTRVENPATAAGLARELRAIVALCVEPVSIAEISARLRLHLGVTKVLVGDLCEAGYLDVHLQDIAGPHDPDTILRVIDGLRAFS